MTSLIPLFSLILILNFLVIIKINYLSELLNIVDKPDGILKKHKEKVFLMGGPIIYLNLSIIFIFALFNKNFNEFFFYFNSYYEFIIFYIISSFFFSLVL